MHTPPETPLSLENLKKVTDDILIRLGAKDITEGIELLQLLHQQQAITNPTYPPEEFDSDLRAVLRKAGKTDIQIEAMMNDLQIKRKHLELEYKVLDSVRKNPNITDPIQIEALTNSIVNQIEAEKSSEKPKQHI